MHEYEATPESLVGPRLLPQRNPLCTCPIHGHAMNGGYRTVRNPELMIVHNPYGRKGKPMARKKRRTTRGRRRSTYKLRAKIGKKHYTHPEFIKRKVAAYKRRHKRTRGKAALRWARNQWKRSVKILGKGKKGRPHCYPSRRTKRIRYANPRRRRRTRRSSWQSLVKKHGVQKAARIYRGRKQGGRKGGRRRRRSFRY